MNYLPISSKQNLKESVIEILSNEWPLSAKKIHSKIKSNGSQFTYQGVHKAVNELHSEGILSKGEQGYSLNRAWLSRAFEQISSAISAYDSKKFEVFSSGSGKISSAFRSISLLKKLLLDGRLRFGGDSIYLCDNRVFLLPVRLYANWFASQKESGKDFYNTARELGVYWYKSLREKGICKVGEVEEELRTGIETVSFAGWGGLDLDYLDTGKKEAKFSTYNSTFAQQYLEQFGKSKKPVDDLLRGTLTGGCAVILGENSLECVETECLAAGSDKCVFEVKPRKAFDFSKKKIIRAQLGKERRVY